MSCHKDTKALTVIKIDHTSCHRERKYTEVKNRNEFCSIICYFLFTNSFPEFELLVRFDSGLKIKIRIPEGKIERKK
jgi:hypothetical protein